mmetsp:Transcript_14092/g.34145  ORF Transcript_14092/g.34145 Transcript_14092/m.34145 type:complete len:1145 (-) Transcript_14092:60-3494(-)
MSSQPQQHAQFGHAESLAFSAASAVVDETRQESANNSPSQWGDESFTNNQIESHPQHWNPSSYDPNAYNSQSASNIWSNDTDSLYSGASTNPNNSFSAGTASLDSSRWYGKTNAMDATPNDYLAASMNRMHMSSSSTYNNYHMHGQEASDGMSMNFGPSSSNSVPGLIGASSGSTSASSRTWNNTNNPYSYPVQQKQQHQHYQQHQYPHQHQHQHQHFHQHDEAHNMHQPQHNMVSLPPGFLSPISTANSHLEEDRQFQKKTPSKRRTNRGGRRGYQDQGSKNLKGKPSSQPRDDDTAYSGFTQGDTDGTVSSKASSEAIRMLMEQPSSVSSQHSTLHANRLSMEKVAEESSTTQDPSFKRPILPAMEDVYGNSLDPTNDDDDEDDFGDDRNSAASKKRDWLLRMNRRMAETEVGALDPSTIPIAAVMNAWAKTKSAQGATMVETWLKRAQEEYVAGNTRVIPSTKMYTMAVDAWAKSGEGVSAAQRAEEILQEMNRIYQQTGQENLRPTTGIFNAVINAWARSREKMAPSRAEQILQWMHTLHESNPTIQPDKYTFNTVIHAYAKSGGTVAAAKAQELLTTMHSMYENGNRLAKPDTITYNVVINAWAKSGGKGAESEAEKLLAKMHRLHEQGDPEVKPNVVTYGAVIDAYAKSGEAGAASRADTLLANMIQLHQADPVTHADLRPNTYVFNTVINCWAKSDERDAASKAEEMLVAMGRLHSSGMPNLKPDAFTYTAVIDAWAKSGFRGAASRADQLLDKMEAKYLAGDMDLKPNTFTYNAVINALAKSGEAGAAARAERVLQNMVNRHRHGANSDVKPTTINFNTVLDAWAKSGGGRQAAERAEEILEWMDRLNRGGNKDVRPDTITFNAVLDAWARSGDRMAPHRAEQILDHMDELYRAGNKGVKPDTYTYNTLINAWAKCPEKGSAERAEHVLRVMNQRYRDGDKDFKPNTRTHTSVIDAWAKSGESGAAIRAEQILNNMIANYKKSGDKDVKPNVHTANAVCNACAFTKIDEDRPEALRIAFRVFEWLSSQQDMFPDAYTYTIILSVCSNLLPKDDTATRYAHAKAFFEKCCKEGYVNDYVLRKLRQTVTEEEYLVLTKGHNSGNIPQSWGRSVGRHARKNKSNRGRKNSGWSQKRKGR